MSDLAIRHSLEWWLVKQNIASALFYSRLNTNVFGVL